MTHRYDNTPIPGVIRSTIEAEEFNGYDAFYMTEEILEAIRNAGYVIVTPFEIGEEVQNAYNRGRREAGAIL
jgi:hypothetical protein